VFGDLPHLTPLLAAVQRLIPHIVVVTDRLGAELIVVQPHDTDEYATIDGDTVLLDPSRSDALADGVIRAALTTSATVRIAPVGTPELAADGVAGLLRYR
jgi:hypothetical protein